MKVKISYTVNLDDVPDEVLKMLDLDYLFVLNEEYTELIKDLSDNNIEKVLLHIDDFRIKLANLDIKLGDAQSILDGYMKARYTTSASEENDEKA